MRPSRVVLFLLPLSLWLTACQTNMGTQFTKLKRGMEKSEVLDIMGSPDRTQRWRGMDRWTYIFYDTDLRNEREIHFAQGKAIYLGGAYRPSVSAEQQDFLNEASNREVEERIVRNREEAHRNLENYENEIRGTESNPAIVPHFEPVQ